MSKSNSRLSRAGHYLIALLIGGTALAPDRLQAAPSDGDPPIPPMSRLAAPIVTPLARLLGLPADDHAWFLKAVREAGKPSPALLVAEASRAYRAGDPVRALTAARKAHAILRNPFYISLPLKSRLGYWATATFFIAQSQRALGQAAGATAAYADTVALGRSALNLDAGNAALGGLVAASLVNLATLRGEAGDIDGAKRLYREGRIFIGGLIDRDETNRELQHMLAATDRGIADLLRRTGDLKGGLEALRSARAREALLVSLDATDAEAWLGQARDDAAIGDILEVDGDHAGALVAYQQAQEALTSFKGDAVTLPPWRFALAEALAGVGTAQEGLGATPEATAAFSEAREIFLALLDLPSGALALRALGATDMHLGVLHEKDKSSDAAIDSYRNAVDAFTTLVSRNVGDDDAVRRLLAAFGRLAALYVASGDQSAALSTYREAREQVGAIPGKQDDVRVQRDLAYFTFQIGRLLVARRDVQGALSALRESLRRFQTAAAASPADIELGRSVWTVGGDLGTILQQRGDLVGALAAYRASATALVRSSDRNSKDPLIQRAYGVSVDRIGSVGYLLLLARDFRAALSAEDFALTLAPDAGWLAGNRAHALMFLGRTPEARAIYLGRTDKWPDGKSWQDGTRADFAEMRKAGLHDPLMEEVEKAFTVSR